MRAVEKRDAPVTRALAQLARRLDLIAAPEVLTIATPELIPAGHVVAGQASERIARSDVTPPVVEVGSLLRQHLAAGGARRGVRWPSSATGA